MTTEQKLFIWFGVNWLDQIKKGTMPSNSTVPEQETMGEQDPIKANNSTD